MIEERILGRCVSRFGRGDHISIDIDGKGKKAVLFLNVFNRHGFSREEQEIDMPILVDIEKTGKNKYRVVRVYSLHGKKSGPCIPPEEKLLQKKKKQSRGRRFYLRPFRK